MTPPSRPHGIGVRGLDFAPESRLFQGRFGRIFRSLPPADYGANDTASQAALNALGDAMMADRDDPKDGPDAEEGGLPAAYTYLGQFVDHDITFDPASSLQRQNDPNALVDFRTPRLDLDSLYGRGPNDQPYLYADGVRLLEGEPLTGRANGADIERAKDLPRSTAAQARAIIGDPRNDENVIVSQLQGLWLRFHNLMAGREDLVTFEQVQREVRFHYQWLVLNDFLPKVVSHHVLHDVIPRHRHKPTLEYYDPREAPFMPFEFSVAAYRFGHSMIRPGYRLNDDIAPLPIFPFPGDDERLALTGFDRFPDTWAIDWARFVDLEPRPFGDEEDRDDPGNAQRMQLAYRIDTSLVNPLAQLPDRVASDPPPSLAGRNLVRGWRLRLPSGQDVARAMGVEVRKDADIEIGKFSGDPGDIVGTIDRFAGGAFKGNCPLWTYVLAETETGNVHVETTDGTRAIQTRRLGPVGGRIVAETIVGMLVNDSTSYLNVDPLWKPHSSVVGHDGKFGLRDLVRAALSA